MKIIHKIGYWCFLEKIYKQKIINSNFAVWLIKSALLMQGKMVSPHFASTDILADGAKGQLRMVL